MAEHGQDLPHLDAVEQRILGSLLEKQVTVPASYPLSLNALRTACNQSTSRDPVVEYDDPLLERVAKQLKERGLLRIVWSDTGRRTLKYHQTLVEALGVDEAERALLTVLLLRGPQAPGELRSRSDRLHGFADRAAVEAVLERLAARPAPLVRQLERQPGQQDHRWVHLLGDPPEAVAVPLPQPDLEVAGADGGQARDERVRTTYAAVAGSYAEHLLSELDDLPFERWLLDRVAEEVGAHPVADVGCGPGHVAAYLAGRGASVTGYDVTPAMVDTARASFPDLEFEVGDLRRMLRPRTHDGWGAVLGWYAMVHLGPSEIPAAVDGLARVLRPGGLLVLALHAGPEVRHVDEWWDHEVELDFVCHDPEQVRTSVAAAGLTDVEWYLRGAMPGRGEQTDRFYVLARRPA